MNFNPTTAHCFSATTKKHGSNAGVMVCRRICSACGIGKAVTKGCKTRPAFICADCAKGQQ